MEHRISEIQIIPIKPKDGIVAFASFVLDEQIYLGSIAISTRPKGGYRLIYPTKKIGPRSINIFHPISFDFGQLIEKTLIQYFEKLMNVDEKLLKTKNRSENYNEYAKRIS